MWGSSVIYLLLVLATASLAENPRKLHRLAGGHLRVINPDPDDSELLDARASGSKDKEQKKTGEEEKKTLSQQVADGKYGLIQKELFTKVPKRPGVVSYDSNPEVPKDNINNLGGLTKSEIWLAENHLLVLKGGTYPQHDDKNDNTASWPPIDDYKAPSRQVKIPSNPKIPPPFPVQLTDDGPLQILGTNSSRTLNGTSPLYALPPPEGYIPGEGPYFPPPYPYPPNATAGETPFPLPPYPPGEYPPGAPFPPFPSNGTLPPYFASLPPGAAILPPPDNLTDQYDEDDPSIYYPPPYSFYFPKDNSSLVPPGPLVPGIILPPPPNFFAPLEETTKKSRTRPTTTKPPTQIYPTTTAVPPTSVSENKPRKPIKVQPVYVPEINNELKPVPITTQPPKVITILPVRQYNRTYLSRTNKPKVTILRPVKPQKVLVYDNEVQRKPFPVYGPPSTIVSTTQVPLKVYYSTANEIETNSVTQAPEKFHIGVTRSPKTTTKRPAQYYFYEEEPKSNAVTTQVPKQYADVPSDYYKPQRPHYIYVTARPYSTQRPRYRFVQQPKKPDTFSIHIARLQNQIHQYYTTTKPSYRNQPKPVYQYSFQAANYRPKEDQDKFRPLPKYSVQIQPAIEIVPTTPAPVYFRQQNIGSSSENPNNNYYTTPRPQPYQYQEIRQSTPKPISQFSFEATPNPVYQGYYTKPDEGYFDDNTKNYFTMFGKKIPSGTSPVPPVQVVESTTRVPFRQYQEERAKPSLQGDTLVNYLQPRPINPNSEPIPQRQNYPQVAKYTPRPIYRHQQQQQSEPEIIKAIPVPNGQEPGSYISYQLPGDDGAHFYFLTPQLAQSRDQGAGYFFAQPEARIRRNNKP